MVRLLEYIEPLGSLGQQLLQALSDNWIATPIAREWGVTKVEVGHKESPVGLSIELAIPRVGEVTESVFFPMDDLLHYLVDHGITEAGMRQQLHEILRDRRRATGPDIWQRYKFQLHESHSYSVRCKANTCDAYFACGVAVSVESRMPTWRFQQELICPLCGVANNYNESDFWLIAVA